MGYVPLPRLYGVTPLDRMIARGERLIDRASFWLGFGTPLGHWLANRAADALEALCDAFERERDRPPPSGGSGVITNSRQQLLYKQWGKNGVWTEDEIAMHMAATAPQPGSLEWAATQNHVILSDMHPPHRAEPQRHWRCSACQKLFRQ